MFRTREDDEGEDEGARRDGRARSKTIAAVASRAAREDGARIADVGTLV
jgi:hypothetical protein